MKKTTKRLLTFHLAFKTIEFNTSRKKTASYLNHFAFSSQGNESQLRNNEKEYKWEKAKRPFLKMG